MAKAYNIITVDRERNVVKSHQVIGWVNALNEIADCIGKAYNAGWKTYPSNPWSSEVNRDLRGRSWYTSFGMTNNGSYYFTYVKAA